MGSHAVTVWGPNMPVVFGCAPVGVWHSQAAPESRPTWPSPWACGPRSKLRNASRGREALGESSGVAPNGRGGTLGAAAPEAVRASRWTRPKCSSRWRRCDQTRQLCGALGGLGQLPRGPCQHCGEAPRRGSRRPSGYRAAGRTAPQGCAKHNRRPQRRTLKSLTEESEFAPGPGLRRKHMPLGLEASFRFWPDAFSEHVPIFRAQSGLGGGVQGPTTVSDDRGGELRPATPNPQPPRRR